MVYQKIKNLTGTIVVTFMIAPMDVTILNAVIDVTIIVTNTETNCLISVMFAHVLAIVLVLVDAMACDMDMYT